VEYSFDIDHAKKYGVDEAIMIKNFQFWIMKNKASKKHFYKNCTWTYNSMESFSELFCFWSPKQIRRILESLKEKGVLITDNFNKISYDRTLWYAFKEEENFIKDYSICPNGKMEDTKRENQSAQTVEPIPDNKPDRKKPDKEKIVSVPETSKLSELKIVSPDEIKHNQLIDLFDKVYLEMHHEKMTGWNRESKSVKSILENRSKEPNIIYKKMKILQDLINNPPDNFWAGMVFLPSTIDKHWDRLVERKPVLSNQQIKTQETVEFFNTWVNKKNAK